MYLVVRKLNITGRLLMHLLRISVQGGQLLELDYKRKSTCMETKKAETSLRPPRMGNGTNGGYQGILKTGFSPSSKRQQYHVQQ